MFYFQNSSIDFALNSFEKISIFATKSNSKIYTAFYKYLFESCPDFYNKNLDEINKYIDNSYSKEEKKQLNKDYVKRYKEYRSKKNKTIIDAFEFDHFQTNIFLNKFYSECN
jgi:hypothetical protein